MNHLVVGIDIAKETHVAGAVNVRGIQIGRTLAFNNNVSGFEKLIRWVGDLQKAYGLTAVIFGAESTGHYFLNLATWLRGRSHQIVLVNPLTTKRNKENRDNKPSKSDAKDAITIADSVSRGYYSEWIVPAQEFVRLRYLVNERESIADSLTALGNQVQTVLDQIFPEFTSVISEWDCPRGLATLKAFPLPGDLVDLTPAQIVDAWREAGMRRAGGNRGLECAARLLSVARRTTGLTEAAGELKRRIGRLLQSFNHLQSQKNEIEQEIDDLLSQLPQGALQPLKSVGISRWLSAVVLANVGDLRQYVHGNQLLALAGLNLAERASGKHTGKIKITKRGRRQLRKYLYLIVVGLVANNDMFRRLHEHNVTILHMKKQQSIFKLIGKLARILVALAQTGEAFDPQRAIGHDLNAA